MNLKQLEYFVRVAELGSFSKASVALRVAQPALSRQIRALETDLRETLLLRNGRGVCLTEAGNRLLDHSIGILELVSRAHEDIEARRGEPGGRIAIGLPPSVGRQLTRPLIDAFRRELPQAQLSLAEGLSAHIGEWIAAGRIDIGLMHNPEPSPALETTPLFDEPLCLIAPPSKSRRRPQSQPVPLKDLPRFPLILPQPSHAIRRLLESQAALAGIKLYVAWEVSSVPAILDLVRTGYGNAVLRESAIDTWAPELGLEVRPIADPQLHSTLCLCIASRKRPSALAKHMLALLPKLVRRAMTKRA